LQTQHGFTAAEAEPGGLRSEARLAIVGDVVGMVLIAWVDMMQNKRNL